MRSDLVAMRSDPEPTPSPPPPDPTSPPPSPRSSGSSRCPALANPRPRTKGSCAFFASASISGLGSTSTADQPHRTRLYELLLRNPSFAPTSTTRRSNDAASRGGRRRNRSYTHVASPLRLTSTPRTYTGESTRGTPAEPRRGRASPPPKGMRCARWTVSRATSASAPEATSSRTASRTPGSSARSVGSETAARTRASAPSRARVRATKATAA